MVDCRPLSLDLCWSLGPFSVFLREGEGESKLRSRYSPSGSSVENKRGEYNSAKWGGAIHHSYRGALSRQKVLRK